jgi:hypothetical protein
VAGDDDRQRVGAAGRPGRAHGALVARLGGDLGVAAGLTVGDAGDRSLGTAPEAVGEPPVERQVELGQLALEVEVELAAQLVELARRLEDARGDACRQVLEQVVGMPILMTPRGVAASRSGPKGESAVA